MTANRWRRILRQLGHEVTIGQEYTGQACEMLLALHAKKSFPAIVRFRRDKPQAPLIVALTGTDLYRDLPASRQARQALEWADRIVVLQPQALASLPQRWHGKTRVIRQSALPVGKPRGSKPARFQVCVLGHLRHEKDPLRAAQALRFLPGDLPLRVVHAGQALTAELGEKARQAMARDGRYVWLGELPRWQARRLLARSHLLVVSSRMEGGANVVSEALVEGVPVLASFIDGNIGMLGAAYPGFFPVGDSRALAALLSRAVRDAAFHEKLRSWCIRLAHQYAPAHEQNAWKKLLEEIIPES